MSHTPKTLAMTGGSIVLGMKVGESLYQHDYDGNIDRPAFFPTGSMAGFTSKLDGKRTVIITIACIDAENDFPDPKKEMK
jgi:hypothetical protein